jgi:hypothetical protein
MIYVLLSFLKSSVIITCSKYHKTYYYIKIIKNKTKRALSMKKVEEAKMRNVRAGNVKQPPVFWS